jgi:hypothetical protein
MLRRGEQCRQAPPYDSVNHLRSFFSAREHVKAMPAAAATSDGCEVIIQPDSLSGPQPKSSRNYVLVSHASESLVSLWPVGEVSTWRRRFARRARLNGGVHARCVDAIARDLAGRIPLALAFFDAPDTSL